MDAAATIREARARRGLSQAEVAARAGTSQATISAYETGRKQPSLDTLGRLLATMGLELRIEERSPRRPSRAEHQRVGRSLVDVLRLAEQLPTRHDATLRYPRLAR